MKWIVFVFVSLFVSFGSGADEAKILKMCEQKLTPSKVVIGACMPAPIEQLISEDPAAAAVAQFAFDKITAPILAAGEQISECVNFESLRKSTRVTGAYTVKAGGQSFSTLVTEKDGKWVVVYSESTPPPLSFQI